MADDELLFLGTQVKSADDDSVEIEQKKVVEFDGTFIEVNLKAVEWLTSHPEVRLVQEVGPIREGCTGPNSYNEPDWTITIEYEERVPAGGRRAA